MSKHNTTPASLLWSLGLESISLEERTTINDRPVERLITEDPVLAGMGGACVFAYQAPIPHRLESFLERSGESADQLQTNNPSLIAECKAILAMPTPTYLALFSASLKARLTSDEFEAVVQHEYGHVHHRHLERQSEGTYEEFIGREMEADDYSVKNGPGGAEALLTGLEKCLKFGAEQHVLWNGGASNGFIRKLIDSDIVDAVTIKFVTMEYRTIHARRFKTLQQLIAQKNKA